MLNSRRLTDRLSCTGTVSRTFAEFLLLAPETKSEGEGEPNVHVYLGAQRKVMKQVTDLDFFYWPYLYQTFLDDVSWETLCPSIINLNCLRIMFLKHMLRDGYTI